MTFLRCIQFCALLENAEKLILILCAKSIIIIHKKLMHMMDILIATKNRHKVEEIRDIFRHEKIRLIDLSHFPAIPEATEDGKTFAENARIKAQYYHIKTTLPVIADDSGLVVPVLDGEPGIYSARYAGPDADYQDNNSKLLEKLKTIPVGQRQAYFVCFAVFWDGRILLEEEGRIFGTIAFDLRGSKGFGYDPLFQIKGSVTTLAEISADEKNRISHRYQAFTKLKNALEMYMTEINIDR